jgi:methionyl-tRNA formyltransferase
MKIIIATIKSWNIDNAEKLRRAVAGKHEITIITKPEDFTLEVVNAIDPRYIFFPHWSWYIPASIFTKHACIGFHETDVPFGRGGSPIQNLIVRGFKETVISAIDIADDMDAGDVYMKHPGLSLDGTVAEILKRASNIIFETMIPDLLDHPRVPLPQTGEVTVFTRRKDNEIPGDITLEQCYDRIRMLDGEGYPSAYILHGKHKIEFTRAQLDRYIDVLTVYFKITYKEGIHVPDPQQGELLLPVDKIEDIDSSFEHGNFKIDIIEDGVAVITMKDGST